MKEYVVSARKYRPDSFEKVVGQESITKTLTNAIRDHQLAQSFLFCGPRGVGKTTCARILAKSINCESLSDNLEPCDSCKSCIGFNESNSFNIHEMDAASNNSVNDIRKLIDQVRFAPQVGKYSVYIIDEVHMLSSGAFNAFLKTLEEPPSHAKFILATTEKHKIIPTILSRCQIFDFKQIKSDDIVGYLTKIANLEDIQFEKEALFLIAQKAEGSLRDALSIFDRLLSYSSKNLTKQNVLDQLNILDSDYYFKILDEVNNENFTKVMLILDEIFKNGFEGDQFINGFAIHLRNLLMSNSDETVSLIEETEEIKAEYLTQSKNFNYEFLVKSLSLCNECDLQYKGSKNQRLLIELCLIRIFSAKHVRSEKKNSKFFLDPSINISDQKNNKQKNELDSDKIEYKVDSIDKKENIQEKDILISDKKIKTKESKTVSITKKSNRSIASEQNLSENDVDVKRSEKFNQEQLKQCWDKTARHIKDLGKSNLFIALKSFEPSLNQQNKIQIMVYSAVQKELILDSKEFILTFLKDLLKNDFIEFNIDIVKEKKENKAITSSDKFKIMLNNNPNLSTFSKHLGLDLDY